MYTFLYLYRPADLNIVDKQIYVRLCIIVKAICLLPSLTETREFVSYINYSFINSLIHSFIHSFFYSLIH